MVFSFVFYCIVLSAFFCQYIVFQTLKFKWLSCHVQFMISHDFHFCRSLIHGRKLKMFEDVVAASAMTFIPNAMLLHHLFQKLLDGALYLPW